jgi:antitoxin component YwqK of YwqJK toxin-antitoxin module
MKRFFENGQKRSESSIKEGRLNGKTIMWYKNGDQEIKINYLDDVAIAIERY